MSEFVLDSSAILAVINLETGYVKVEPILRRSAASSVNIAEVLTKLVEKGVSLADALEEFLQLGIMVSDFGLIQAEKSAELRPLTKHLGLSMGDRACLALAINEKATAVTADTSWSSLTVCAIEVIR